VKPVSRKWNPCEQSLIMLSPCCVLYL